MSLEDLLSTVQPFGQSMAAGKRSVGPRSAKYRVAARRLGGKFTPEGREMLMKGEQLRLMEPNIATPESRDLMNKGEQIKAAYASGGLDLAKDLKPLRQQWFQDVQASSLSSEDKEGIRQMFTKDFLDAGKELDAEAQRNFNLKSQQLGLKKSKQDIQNNKTILETGKLSLESAKRKDTRALNELNNEALTSTFIDEQLMNLENAEMLITRNLDGSIKDITPFKYEGEEKKKAVAEARERTQNAITKHLAQNPDLSPSSLRALDSLAQQVGVRVKRAEALEDRQQSFKQGIVSMIANMAISKGVEGIDPTDLSETNITNMLTKVAKANKADYQRKNNARLVDNILAVTKEISSPYMDSLKSFPESGADFKAIPRTSSEAARAQLESYIERAKNFLEDLEIESPEVSEKISELEARIKADEFLNVSKGVDGQKYYMISNAIENVMVSINSLIYGDKKRVLSKEQQDAQDAYGNKP